MKPKLKKMSSAGIIFFRREMEGRGRKILTCSAKQFLVFNLRENSFPRR